MLQSNTGKDLQCEETSKQEQSTPPYNLGKESKGDVLHRIKVMMRTTAIHIVTDVKKNDILYTSKENIRCRQAVGILALRYDFLFCLKKSDKMTICFRFGKTSSLIKTNRISLVLPARGD